MSSFDTMMGLVGRPLLLRESGQSITYRHPDIEPVTLTATVTPLSGVESETDGRRIVRYTRDAIISTDPAAAEGGIATPKANAEVQIGAEVWAIERIEMLSGSLARLVLTQPKAAEVGRSGYRSS